MVASDPDFQEMSKQEQNELLEVLCDVAIAEVSYADVWLDGPGDIAFFGLFSLLGLYYGFRVGSGSGRSD